MLKAKDKSEVLAMDTAIWVLFLAWAPILRIWEAGLATLYLWLPYEPTPLQEWSQKGKTSKLWEKINSLSAKKVFMSLKSKY